MRKKYYCIDCRKQVSDYRVIRCRKCKGKSEKGKNNPNYKHGLTNKSSFCIDCKIKLSNTASFHKYKRCRLCYYKYFRKENHPNWNNGSSFAPYSIDFTKKLKEKIRERDNYKCKICGLTEKENLKLYNKKLNVHHVDYDKQNCKEDNLISLCSSCHMKTHYNREKWTKLFKNKTEEIYVN